MINSEVLLNTHTFIWLNVSTELPQHHKDPFDRMLISQSQTEDMVLVSKDSAFDAYDVEVVERRQKASPSGISSIANQR